MDTERKESLIKHNVIMMLPDEPDNVHGPATLFMIPRHVIRAWIKMTPKLNEVMERLFKMAVARAVEKNPEAIAKYIASGEKDNSIVEDVLAEPDFVKVYNTLQIAAIADLRVTMGADEFNGYAVTDPEVIRAFTKDVQWKAYSDEGGWVDSKSGKDRIDYDEGSGKVRIKDANT